MKKLQSTATPIAPLAAPSANITDNLALLDSEISKLNAVLDELYQCIDPVLLPEVEAANLIAAKEAFSRQSTISFKINEIRNRISGATERAEGIISRLDLLKK